VTHNRISGVVNGHVTDLDDPDRMGRVKLEFRWMGGGSQPSNWARIAAPMSGAERGMQFMPEVGDEVLVAFENGNPEAPYVIGYLWNGEQAPPRQEPKKRVIQTVSGHVLEFDDNDGSEMISLKFKGDKPAITISQDALTIKFNDQSYIELTASSLKLVNNTLVEINP
jgi:uncharacterized protein involved in type VI secretion and phage assembly